MYAKNRKLKCFDVKGFYEGKTERTNAVCSERFIKSNVVLRSPFTIFTSELL